MDYVDLMKEYCAPAVVSYVQEVATGSDGTAPWPDNDFFGDDHSDRCRIAVMLYRAEAMGAETGLGIASNFCAEATLFFGELEDADKAVVAAALGRLAGRVDEISGYFRPITRHAIDVRAELLPRFPARPEPATATPGTQPISFLYLRYLTAMGDREAEEDLVEALRLETNPSEVNLSLSGMAEMPMPNWRRVMRNFTEDGRQSLTSIGTPGLVVAGTARTWLGIGPYEGPVRLLDNLGRPIDQ